MVSTSAASPLLERIRVETGLVVTSWEDEHVLTGMFNQFRPYGDGIERILSDTGVEGAVRSRIKRVYEASAPGCYTTDLYFIVRQPKPLDAPTAMRYAEEYLRGIERLATLLGCSDYGPTLKSLTVTAANDTTVIGALDEDNQSMVYECVADFLADFQPDRHELFYLNEALYSMTATYFLMAWMLWPVIQQSTPLPDLLDPYFALWSHGLSLHYAQGNKVYVVPF